MKNELANTYKNYKDLVSHISKTYILGREKAVIAVNKHLVETYWKIGQYIVEFEQKGKERAKYGTELLKRLSRDLKLQHGKGFSLSNIKRMRQFYITFPKGATAPHLLGWSHYVEILKINDKLERSFYLQQTINEKWSEFIDLKREEAGYEDIGQMNMYLGYFENEENTEGDNPPISIVLAKEKDELLVQYAMHNISSQLFVNKYQLYLPNREELRKAIEEQLKEETNDE